MAKVRAVHCAMLKGFNQFVAYVAEFPWILESLGKEQLRTLGYSSGPDVSIQKRYLPSQLSTGSGQFYLLALCHMPAKLSKFSSEKSIILSLFGCVRTNLIAEFAYLFFLRTVLACIEILRPVVHVPGRLNGEEKRYFF